MFLLKKITKITKAVMFPLKPFRVNWLLGYFTSSLFFFLSREQS